MRLFLTALLLAAFALPAAADEGADRAALKARIEALLRDTKTATWFQDVWSTNGKDEETTAAECFWQGQDKMRLNVKKGRGAGATALLKDNKIIGFKPGLFSFVKLTYDVRDKEVLGLRGGDMRSNGFMDDLAAVVAQWETVGLTAKGANTVIAYKNGEGLATELTLDTATLRVSLIEAREQGKVVERFQFRDVVYNPVIEAKVFNP